MRFRYAHDCQTGETTQVPYTPEEEAAADAQAAAEAAEAPRKGILAQIIALEASMTPRRIREAVKGPTGKAWLDNLDDQIAALRAQLT